MTALGRGPLARVRFDRLSAGGRFPDGSGAGRAPVLLGGGVVVPDDRFGRCLRLDGSGGVRYGDAPALEIGGSFSFELWFAADPTPTAGVLWQHRVRRRGSEETLPLVEAEVSADGLRVRVGDTTTPPLAPAEGWRHVAVTADEGARQFLVYLDGVAAGTFPAPLPPIDPSWSELWIGTDADGGRRLTGSVGSLRVYDRLRGAGEIVEGLHRDRAVRPDPGVPRPLVHLPFHVVGADGLSPDESGNAHHAAARGAPRAVADGFLGRSTELDGHADSFEVAAAADLRPVQALTIEAWVHPVGVSEVDAIVELPTEPVGRRPPRYGLHLERGHLRAYVDGDNVAVATARLTSRSWHHVAVTWDGDVREVTLLVDGVPVPVEGDGRTPSARITYLDEPPLRIGARGTPSHYAGRLAGLRLYDRALSREEVAADLHADRVAAGAAFDLNYPISLRIFDDGGGSTLSIVEEGALGRVCHVAVRNDNVVPIEFPASHDGAPGPDHHHLELRFRPFTLSADALSSIAVLSAGWRIAHRIGDDGTQSLYALLPTGLTLRPGERHVITLAHVDADPGGGARSTRVLLRYGSLRYADDRTPLVGSRLERLEVVDRRGLSEPPLRVAFVGPGTITNDGRPNRLVLVLSNTSPTEPVLLRGPAGAAPVSRFLLRFDEAPDRATPLTWAVATHDEVAATEISTGRADLFCDKDELGPATIWTLRPLDEDVTLAPGGEILLELDGLRTTMAEGTGELHVEHENVPGFQDGRCTVRIEKRPWVWGADDVAAVRAGLPERAAALASVVDGHREALAHLDAELRRAFDHTESRIAEAARDIEALARELAALREAAERLAQRSDGQDLALERALADVARRLDDLSRSMLRKGAPVTITQQASGRTLDAYRLGGYEVVTREGVTFTRIWTIDPR
ncbi:LamG-like jellyroll fold domain-containing protein [Nocardioides sp. YIM 152588]|uniref:LamG-like jellyroll fold domain-containing protein n=1 Tax=Nocardioides sp. YIM 152588 TaxID=3158259 RepID=UPI0032E395D1